MTAFEPVPPSAKAVCDPRHRQGRAAAQVAAPGAFWEVPNSEGDSAKKGAKRTLITCFLKID